MSVKAMEPQRTALSAIFGGLPPRTYFETAGLYLAGYLLLDWASFVHDFRGLGIVLWSPHTALSLALLLTRGFAYAPVTIFAEVLADGIIRDFPFGPVVSISTNALLGAGHVLVALCLRAALGKQPLDQSMRGVLSLAVVAPLVSLVIAGAYVGSLVAFGVVRRFFLAGTILWIGEATAILSCLPFFLTARRLVDVWARLHPRERAIDISITIATTAVALWLIFRAPYPAGLQFFYLLFVPVSWAAVKHGLPGAAAAIALVQSSLVVALLGLEYPAEQFRSFQTMMLALAPTGLLLGTIVSQRARAEAALRAKQTELSGLSRVMAIGAMGSALAHELSQPLAAIAAFAHGARRLVAGGATDREKLDRTLGEIAGQSQRAGEVLRQLRDFVAQGKFEPADVMLAPLIARAIDHVASAGLSARIAISVSCPAGLRVRGDALHLEHVILNLVRNAADALQGAGLAQGRIAVEAREAGDQVEIIVSDNGPGVSPALHDRLFEPFATGKTTGMGLGLAIGREIAEAHGGTLVHEESDGRGARFVLRLPTGREL